MSILELLQVVKTIKPFYNIKYVIDEMVKADNKIVLRLPHYHCELNPIGLARAAVKRHVKDNNKTFKLQDVKKLLEEGVDTIDGDMWRNCIRHVKKEEEKAWELDNVVDKVMTAEKQPCFLTVGDSENDTVEVFRYLSGNSDTD